MARLTFPVEERGRRNVDEVLSRAIVIVGSNISFDYAADAFDGGQNSAEYSRLDESQRNVRTAALMRELGYLTAFSNVPEVEHV